jgi:hypothetical protein
MVDWLRIVCFCLYEICSFWRNILYIFFRFLLDSKSWCLSVMYGTCVRTVLLFTIIDWLWRRHKQHNRTERRAVEYCMYI